MELELELELLGIICLVASAFAFWWGFRAGRLYEADECDYSKLRKDR